MSSGLSYNLVDVFTNNIEDLIFIINTDFEFEYMTQPIKQTKMPIYQTLQIKYKKHHYSAYNYI